MGWLKIRGKKIVIASDYSRTKSLRRLSATGGLAVFLVLAQTSCESELSAVGVSEHSGRSAAVFARIGAISVSEKAVESLAGARGLSGAEAWRRLRDDALLAEYFAKSHPLESASLRRVTSAKALLGQLRSEQIAKGPPTNDELSAITTSRFWEVARPRMVQVVHAVVLSEEENEDARQLAEKLAAAAQSATGISTFAKTVRAVEAGSFEVKVEGLEPMDATGRTVNPDNPPPAGPAVGQMVEKFAKGVHALQNVGDISGVIRTRFGYHVIFLHKQWASQGYSESERREHHASEIFDDRTRRAQDQLLEKLHQLVAPAPERSATTRMAAWGKDE